MARDAVAEIKGRLDIVDVVGGYVTLQRAGRQHRALCPFHSEKTPSFNVSQERQAWYCFGCQEGGDMFTFVEKVEHTEFRQALELLAEKAGVELEAQAQSPARRGAAQRRKRTLELNSRAGAFFQHVLWSSPAGRDGRDLLAARAVDESAARRFGVGFAPAGGAGEDALSRYLAGRAAATVDEIVEAGLGHHARGGRLRDRFRHRLVFPIREERGEVIAFGARALGDDVPKYLNSPETAVYHKGSALFGIDLARTAMHERRVAVIVEGYFDVMAAHLAGLANTVASSGTALSREQAKVLTRHADTVVLCFDADEAGRAAASRAVDVVAAEGLPARICILPEDVKDPDELVRRDPAAFTVAVNEAPPEWQVLLDRALGGDEGGSIDARRVAAERAVAVLARIPEASAREMYVQQAAGRLRLTAATLASDVAAALHAVAAGRPLRVSVAPPAVAAAADATAETSAPSVAPAAWDGYLATLCVHRPEIASRLSTDFGLDVAAIQSPMARRMIELARATPPGQRFPLTSLPAAERDFAAGLLLRTVPELLPESRLADLDTAIADCVRLVAEAQRITEISDLSRRMASAKERGDTGEVGRLAARLRQLATESPRLRRSAGTG
ncbi:MAG: DNA primase [Candidatus Dormibacteraeota bacterium]|uniref:DNA primase n=1 Tax=Candidatus Amunia macphersoniae TaxID=3127014 RepID=A0A934KLC6_9BACT|nr:DNA primase [Candidatus Dormibacteraeota bacterium]